jgi:hypothetical protein
MAKQGGRGCSGSSGNSLPEILLRTVRSGRGRSRCPGAQTGKTTCQGGALG